MKDYLEKINKGKNDSRIYYGKILDESTIATIGELITAFEKQQITYAQLKSRMESLGYPLSITPSDNYKTEKLVRSSETFFDRQRTESYLAKDISTYNTTTTEGIAIWIQKDRRMLNALAAFGNLEAIEQVNYLEACEYYGIYPLYNNNPTHKAMIEDYKNKIEIKK